MKASLTWLRAAVLSGSLALAACGSGGADGGKDTLELRVADQLHSLRSPLEASGEGNPDGYSIAWSNFLGGPPVIAAQTGGSIDLGWMAETPMIFAQAAGSPVKVVAVSKSVVRGTSPYALVVKPDSPIKTVADLKGKSVTYSKGTVVHHMVANLLDRAGLSLNDVKPVQGTGLGIGVLENGTADALTLTEPYLTQMLESGKVRVLATGSPPITPGYGYLVASQEALDDPRRAKAIEDFVARASRSLRWQRENVDKAAPVAAKLYKIDTELAKKVLQRAPTGYVPIDDSIIAAHQAEADLFFKLGLLRSKLDTSKIFDNRFNAVVAKEDAR